MGELSSWKMSNKTDNRGIQMREAVMEEAFFDVLHVLGVLMIKMLEKNPPANGCH